MGDCTWTKGYRPFWGQLRRTGVGPFAEADAVTLERLQTLVPAEGGDRSALASVLSPVAAALHALPSLSVSRADAARLARGQGVLLRGRDAPIMTGLVAVSTQGSLIALAEIEQGELRPKRIFNLTGMTAPAKPDAP